jgi:ADP-heptose:LPS heptosyltransferase
MPEKILFLVRSKLGDSLVAVSVIQEYASRHPDQEITALVRSNYAEIVAGEGGIHVVPYKNRLQAFLYLLARRLLRGRFDVFAVLVGYGDIVPKLARLSGARRRIYLDGRFAGVLPEYPPALSMDRQVDPPWQVASLIDPGLPKPEALRMETLSARRRGKERGKAIGIAPLSDEKRRDMDAPTLEALLGHLAVRHPGSPLYVFLNPGEESIVPPSAPSSTRRRTFPSLPRLLDDYADLSEWYGTDTGLYHLAAASGIPCTVFFGPTQPKKNVMPRQDTRGIRLDVLGQDHCDVKSCRFGACLHQAIINHCGVPNVVGLEPTPPECPLRRFADDERLRNRKFLFGGETR